LVVSTAHEAFLDKSLSIGSISRTIGDTHQLAVKALLNIILGDIILFLNVGKTMTGPQLTETVGLVVKHYSHFKPKDFKLCIEGVKKGNHGPLYDRIDGQVILSWFKDYDAERDYIAAEVNSNSNEVYKMNDKTPLLAAKTAPTEEKYKELAGKYVPILRAKLNENKIAREKQREAGKPQLRDIDPIAALHKSWIQQFDDLHYIQHLPGRNRLVRKYGMIVNPFYKAGQEPACKLPYRVPRMLDINAYLEHKQWQYQMAQLSHDERMDEYLNKYK
jgi:hypothetical protein